MTTANYHWDEAQRGIALHNSTVQTSQDDTSNKTAEDVCHVPPRQLFTDP